MRIITRRNKWAKKDPTYNFGSDLYLVEGDRSTLKNSFFILNVDNDPLTFNEAISLEMLHFGKGLSMTKSTPL